MTEKKQYVITFETVVEAEDLFGAVEIANKLKKEYGLDLKGVMVYGDVE